MPWNNQTGNNNSNGTGGGPWGTPPEGPRNEGPGKGPDIEELLRKSQNRLKQVFPSGGGSSGFGGANPIIIGFAILIALGFIFYNFFTFRVETNEQGVVLRFGEPNRIAQPGLNFRLPYPIEKVETPQVTRVNRHEIGMRASNNQISSIRDIPEESLMLTGDENIVDIDFEVFWVINNASDYLFNLRDPDSTVKAVAESAMREVVGSSDIQPILTQARQITETAALELMQKTLDSYGAGIEITQLKLLKVDPPSEVIDAFRDVQAARADAERAQNVAQTHANKVLPEARGKAAKILEEAAIYRAQKIAHAEGQSDRFLKVLSEYSKAPEAIRTRIYLETMERVLTGMDKIIINDSENGNSSVVPYLPLNELRRTTNSSQN